MSAMEEVRARKLVPIYNALDRCVCTAKNWQLLVSCVFVRSVLVVQANRAEQPHVLCWLVPCLPDVTSEHTYALVLALMAVC